MARTQRPPSQSNEDLTLRGPAPPELNCTELVVGDERFVVLSFPCPPEPPLPGLSPAENAVARAANAGLTNVEIAAHRRCSASTVYNQLANAYRKLGISSRGELAALIAQLEDHEA